MRGEYERMTDAEKRDRIREIQHPASRTYTQAEHDAAIRSAVAKAWNEARQIVSLQQTMFNGVPTTILVGRPLEAIEVAMAERGIEVKK